VLAAGALPAFSPTGESVGIATNGSVRALFDASGNLGLGVTPSAWAASARALDFSFPLVGMDTAGSGVFGFNCYNSTGSTWNYKSTDEACLFTATTSGTFTWRIAPSGTANAAISFTEVMAISATGAVTIGGTLDVTGVINANGAVQLSGQNLRWNEVAVRSWTLGTAASSGNLTLDSGSGTGIFRVNLPMAALGTLAVTGAFGMNGKTPVVNVAAPTAAGATYTATEQALLNDIRTRLINLGIYT